MARDKENNTYGLEDFRRYQDGEMSFSEQHLFEKQLMEDPFLAEAFEGFTALKEHDVPYEKSMSELEERLLNRIKKQKSNQFLPLWRYVAAAFLILGIGVAWMVYFQSGGSKPDRQELLDMAVIPNIPGKEKVDEPVAPFVRPKTEVSKKNENIISRNSEKIAYSDSPEQEQVSDAVIVESPVYAARQAEPSAPAATPALPAPALIMAQGNLKAITGRVTDENGEKLPGVQVRSGQNESVTNVNGDFVVNSRIGDSVSVSYIGFEAKTVKIDKTDLGNVKMDQANLALNEVVIVGYGNAQKKSGGGLDFTQERGRPEPGVGWEAYQSYLNGMTDSSSLSGVVKVSFILTENGTMTDFKADGPAQLRERAIDIVRTGPVWTPGKTNRLALLKRLEVEVRFGKK